MGIQGLWDYLRKCDAQAEARAEDMDQVRVLEPIDDFCGMFRGKTLGMDTSIFMHQIIDSANNPSVFYVDLYNELQTQGINIEFYFDGKRAPIKQHEHQRRREARQAEARRQDDRRRMVAVLQAKADDQVSVHEIMADARDTDPSLARELHKQTRLRIPGLFAEGDDSAPVLQVDVAAVIGSLMARIEKHDNREPVSDEHYQDLMRTLRERHIPFLVADTEAEKLGAQKVREGRIAAFITNDGDAMTFGCPVMIRNFRKHSQPLQMVRLERVLRALNVDYPQFVDACIITGCDFTESKGLPNMGLVKALAAIKEHGSLDSFVGSAAFRGYLRRTQTSDKYKTFTMDQFNFVDARAMFLDRSEQAIDLDDTVLFSRHVRTSPESTNLNESFELTVFPESTESTVLPESTNQQPKLNRKRLLADTSDSEYSPEKIRKINDVLFP